MERENKDRVVILGSGPAGLGAAYQLSQRGYQVSIIDRAGYVGGASASFKIKDYIVDYGPHAFHIKKEEIVAMVKMLTGDNCNVVRRKSRLILDGKNLEYPLNIKEAVFKINPLLSLKIFIDYVKIKLRGMVPGSKEIKTFQDWGIEAFGYTLYRLAFGNYSEKMWGVSGSLLSRKLAQQKLLKLNLFKIILKTLGIGSASFEGGVREYYDLYPRLGIGTLFDNMKDEILKGKRNQLFLNADIKAIEGNNRCFDTIHFEQDGKLLKCEFDYLVSSIPLKYFCHYLDVPEKAKLVKEAEQLKYRDIRIIYAVLDKDYFSNAHWIYFLDEHFNFNRLSEQKNLNEESSPADKTVLSLDMACNYGDKIWRMSEEEFFRLAMEDLSRLGVEREHILDYFSLKLEDVYPVYDLGFDRRFREILNIIKCYPNMYSIGRQGLFLNNDIHDSLEMGILCGEFIAERKDSSGWYEHIGEFIRKTLEGSEK